MLKRVALASSLLAFSVTGAWAVIPTGIQVPPSCAGVTPGSGPANTLNSQLKNFLSQSVSVGGSLSNGGLGFNMWATLVANDGTVCAVAFSGTAYTDQWLASRVISAQKAATANSLSLGQASGASAKGAFALSTANLYSAVRDGGSLFGLQFSNPVDPDTAYRKSDGTTPDPTTFGTGSDPMIGRPVGGVNVFGGGLAAYSSAGVKVGGLGVSGDTSCTDHVIAWRLRHRAGLDYLATAGVTGPAGGLFPDNIIFDIPDNNSQFVGANGLSVSGFGHPKCINTPVAAAPNLAPVQ
ncbi:hypothetical protein ACNHKD_12470 [Methylocystis sp. JAN1]|uniref:hypothetical protein n=1 Tax=Methylocystis sp. JAN1 TaxID=3397211 RepID=UPI003FA1C22F